MYDGTSGKEPSSSARDTREEGLIPGLGGSPGGRHDHPLQYSCLENPMDRGIWWARDHRVIQSHECLKWLSTYGSSTFNLKRNSILFSIVAAPIYIPTKRGQGTPPSPHLYLHLSYLVLMMIVILIAVRWYLIVALICISLMISGTEYLFMQILDIVFGELYDQNIHFF